MQQEQEKQLVPSSKELNDTVSKKKGMIHTTTDPFTPKQVHVG